MHKSSLCADGGPRPAAKTGVRDGNSQKPMKHMATRTPRCQRKVGGEKHDVSAPLTIRPCRRAEGCSELAERLLEDSLLLIMADRAAKSALFRPNVTFASVTSCHNEPQAAHTSISSQILIIYLAK